MRLSKVVFLSLFSAISTQAAALDFHGYFRSGAGTNNKGGDQTCFKLPGAQSDYRLGNECETYGNLKLGERIHEADDGSWFRVQTQFAFESAGEKDFEDYSTAMREVFAEGGGLLGGHWKETRFWIGKRLLRQDVYMTDFFYWDNSGVGGGFDNLNFDTYKLSYSLIQNIKDGFNDSTGTVTVNDGSDRAITTHDLRFYDINSNPDGKLTIGLAAITASNSRNGKGTDGWQLHLLHQQKPLAGGFNRLILQYGKGAGASLGKNPDDTADSGDASWRLVEQISFESGDEWAGQATFVYENQVDKQQWISYGIRPIYHFTDHFNIALELGHDRVDPETGETLELTKLTIAPQLAAGRGFFSRPVLRLFITYASWNEAARDAASSPVAGGTAGVFGEDTQGLTYGLQVESWW
ncbi:MAG: carbohydrate porin [Gammaproteobacteria bacterium]|nr:carbohydrate porin [Gammaproteobacteria bacterium]